MPTTTKNTFLNHRGLQRDRLLSTLCFALCLIGLSLTNVSTMFAQGSPYYFFGFGDPISATHSRLQGLNQSGAALTDGSFVNQLNPASWTNITRTSIDIGLRYSFDRSDLASNQTNYQVFKISGLNAGIPISSDASIAVALGATPVTDAEAKTIREEPLGATIYKREGGLSSVYLGIAGRPLHFLSLGIRGDILFGTVRTEEQATFTGSNIASSLFDREYGLSGIRENISMQLLLDSLIPSLRGFVIGASFSTPSSLRSDQRTVVTPLSNALDSTIETRGYASYPSQLNLGIATRFGDRYRMEADLSTQDFSSSFLFALTSDASGDATLGASNRYSIAVERMALMGEEARGTGFFERAGLRFGLSYATLPFSPASGVTVNELSASLGLGIPFASGSMIDFATQIGIRTPSNTDIAPKELFFKLGATITVSEKWFVPLRRQDDE